jgi:hypothetical protein
VSLQILNNPSDTYNVSDSSIERAERVSKLPGITVRDIRVILGVPPLTGDEALSADIVLNIPHQDFWETGYDGPTGGTSA